MMVDELHDAAALRRRQPFGTCRDAQIENGRLLRHEDGMALLGIDQLPARNLRARSIVLAPGEEMALNARIALARS